MNEKEKKDERNELDVLFPNKVIELSENFKVTVKPLSAENLSKAIKPFSTLLEKVTAGGHPALVVFDAVEAAMQILPYCIDKPLSEIPATKIPELLEAMGELNLTPESVKKWKALVQKIVEKINGGESQSA